MTQPQPQQQPLKAWGKSGLFELGTDHGCLTGDCPHQHRSQCDATILGYIAELCEEGQQLQERVETLEGHLNWIGWSSEGVERAMRGTATLAEQNKQLADERDQLREMLNREIRRRRHAERELQRGNQLLHNFQELMRAIINSPFGALFTEKQLVKKNPWITERLEPLPPPPHDPGRGCRAGLWDEELCP